MTTFKNIEQELLQSHRFLKNLIKSAVDAIIAADMTGKILLFNDAACEICGYKVNEVIEKLNIQAIYPDNDAKRVMHILRSDKYGEKGVLRSFRVDIKKKSGEIIPISLNASIVYDDDKEVATLGFFHDLRETLKIEEELEKTRVQLLQSAKMASVGELAAGVAHQLNNPLGGITLYSQLLMEDYTLPDGAQQDLKRIIRDAQRCTDTVQELLKFSRQTTNEMHLQDINQLLSETLILVKDQTLFHNIEIKKNFQNNLPLVPVDIQQIKHVFMNIILNAADAMEGQGVLSLFTSHEEPLSDRVCITISDTGHGIPDDILIKIFDPFFTTKEQGKGTGLGLSMAYRIVEDHGGKMSAESKTGEGTNFLIELMLPETESEKTFE
ncbi:MAG: ATP-binding protein [Deltaproteobacteria bacterium]|jgi:two-component system NtrC family sensor kinase|nr:ATP-binding protein [Deltaproteobacteria bacterium]